MTSGPSDMRKQLFCRCRLLVRRFYAVAFCLVLIQSLIAVKEWTPVPLLDPVWPAAWLQTVSPSARTPLVIALSLGATAVGAWWWQRRMARAFAFFGLLELAALESSYGHTVHVWHTWLIASGVLILLPDTDGHRRRDREAYILVLWGAIMMVLWTYTLAGAWKLLFAVGQWWNGQIHALHPDALPILVADQLLKKGGEGFFTQVFMNHRFWGLPLYAAALLLEAFSIVVAFRPRLHRLWGICLVLMHLGIYLIMNILFWQAACLCALLLIHSPFTRHTEDQAICGKVN